MKRFKQITNAIIIVAGLGLGGFWVYDYFAAGLHTRPEMPEGAFSLSFSGDGPRVIMQGVPDERLDRQYISRRYRGVPEWHQKSWSWCEPPNEDERRTILETVERPPGLRLEAKCELDLDGEIVPTALIFSTPKA